MAKWRKDMTEEQRRRYNEYMRKRHLRKRLESGAVPIPRKTLTREMEHLYRRFRADKAAVLPTQDITGHQYRILKEEEKILLRKLREAFRNKFPADMPEEEFTAKWKSLRENELRGLLILFGEEIGMHISPDMKEKALEAVNQAEIDKVIQASNQAHAIIQVGRQSFRNQYPSDFSTRQFNRDWKEAKGIVCYGIAERINRLLEERNG